MAAKLDWKVDASPVNVNGKVVPGYKANVRSDTKDVLGIVSDRYRVIQNDEAFSFTDSIIGKTVHYETAGSLEGGKRIYLLARMPDFKLLGDDIESYLFFMNSHNGKSGIIAGVTNVRIVCNNTLQLAINSAPRLWKTKHTGDIQAKVREARETLTMAKTYLHASKEMAEEMVQKKISAKALTKFMDALFPVDAEATERVKRNVATLQNQVLDIYMNKPDLANFRGTAWGLYNAVADMASNAEPLRRTSLYEEKKLASFMDGIDILANAQALLVAA